MNKPVDETIAVIKRETFEAFKTSRHVWIVEERGAEFIVHTWNAGVGPPTSYPTLRKAVARFLQLVGTGPVAPQTWPEDICVGYVKTTGSAHEA